MKKVICSMTIVMMISMLAACQPTPQDAVVVGKGEDQVDHMMEQIITTPELDNRTNTELPATSYQAPKRLEYSYEVNVNGGTLQVDINADVIIPEFALPMVLVKSSKINFEQVNSIVNLIAGNTPLYYEAYANQIMTKAKYQSEVDYYTWELEHCTDEMQSQREYAQQQIKKIYKLMESAPATYADAVIEADEPTYMEGENGEWIPLYDEPSQITEDMIGSFTFTQENYDKRSYSMEIGEAYRTPSLNIYALADSKRQGIQYRAASYPGAPFAFRLSDMSLMDDFEMSSDTAIQMADKYAQAIDPNLKLTDISPAVSVDHSGEQAFRVPYGYMLIYQRQFNGVNLNYAEERNPWGPYYTHSEQYNEPYYQEFLRIMVNPKEVYSLEYYNPMQEIQQLANNVGLLPFDKIKEKIDQYLVLGNFDASLGLRLKIDRIELGLMRIVKPDSTDEYLIIPVWDCYGNFTKINNDNPLDLDLQFYGRSFLTINAVDGSIIDRELGY